MNRWNIVAILFGILTAGFLFMTCRLCYLQDYGEAIFSALATLFSFMFCIDFMDLGEVWND